MCDHAASPSVFQLHASCAARGDAGVLLLGAPGSGKSDLLLRLIDRGFDLVADDRVLVQAGQAVPHASLAGLIEIRGIGLLHMPHRAPVPLALALALDAAAASDGEPWPSLDPDALLGQSGTVRLPQPMRHRRLGLPLLRLDPFTVSAALHVEIALDCLAGRRALHTGGLPPLLRPALRPPQS